MARFDPFFMKVILLIFLFLFFHVVSNSIFLLLDVGSYPALTKVL